MSRYSEDDAVRCKARKEEITLAIASALKAADVKFKLGKYTEAGFGWNPIHYITITHGEGAVRVNVTEEKRGFLWNGKLRVKVEWWRANRQFQERKDGYDYAGIAQCVKNYLKAKEDYDTRRNLEDEQAELARDIESKIRADYKDVLDSSYVRLCNHGRPDGFEVQISGLDEESFRSVMTALRGLGYLEK